VGGPLFYAGFRDIDAAGDTADAFGPVGNLTGLGEDELEWYESQFLTMQKAIFSDLAWQHEAFALGGAAAIARAVRKEPAGSSPALDARTLRAWDGIGSGDPGRIAEGNLELIRREQLPVIQPYYSEMLARDSGGLVTGQLTDRSDTPIPGSQRYSEYSSERNLANYPDRIRWIKESLWPAHQELLGSPGAVEEILGRDFDAEADRYRQFDPGLAPGDIKDAAEEGAKDLVEDFAPRGPYPTFYP